MRTPLIAGNWKMNKSLSEARELARGVVDGVADLDDVDVVVGPTNVCLTAVRDIVHGTKVGLSAQNMHWAENGAYTGEVGPTMLLDAGCDWIILGHSERRQYFGETDELVNQKVKSALSHGLAPIVCVGETLAEREAGKTREKVDFQVRAALSGVRKEDIRDVVIAYEPIWAIGTGRTASPEQAQEVHAEIRSLVEALYSTNASLEMRILYGGSVKPHNIGDLIIQPDIDGGLIGGASLKAESFVAIAETAAAE